MRRAVAAVAVAGLALAAPTAASAHRTATKTEARAMLAAAFRVGPTRCIRADIGTVVRGSRWGAITFNTHAGRDCRAYSFDGIEIEHKVGRTWILKWDSDEIHPIPTNRPPELAGKVPREVYGDLYRGLF